MAHLPRLCRSTLVHLPTSPGTGLASTQRRTFNHGRILAMAERQKDEQGKVIEVKLDQPRVFYAAVFNATQMENIPEAKPVSSPWQPEEAAERILQASGADIRYDKSDTAFYSPAHDKIHMPPKILFEDARAFYSTALHELGHWSGHPSRLSRDLSDKFGTEGYAKEELRAELASYFVASRLGIPHDPSSACCICWFTGLMVAARSQRDFPGSKRC